MRLRLKNRKRGNKSSRVPATENAENIIYLHTMPDLIEKSESEEQNNCPNNMPELSQDERFENMDCTPNMPDLMENHEEMRYMTKKRTV